MLKSFTKRVFHTFIMQSIGNFRRETDNTLTRPHWEVSGRGKKGLWDYGHAVEGISLVNCINKADTNLKPTTNQLYPLLKKKKKKSPKFHKKLMQLICNRGSCFLYQLISELCTTQE